jgi:hypothetical protein
LILHNLNNNIHPQANAIPENVDHVEVASKIFKLHSAHHEIAKKKTNIQRQAVRKITYKLYQPRKGLQRTLTPQQLNNIQKQINYIQK